VKPKLILEGQGTSIYISTSGHKGNSVAQARYLAQSGFMNIELSGGSHVESLEDDLIDLHAEGLTLMLHNYFPPPLSPFVMNLASADEMILQKSMDLATTAIDLSSRVSAKHYAVHAGFQIDPKVSELGSLIEARQVTNRSESLLRFQSSIDFLARYAKSRNVQLLVENNVLSSENLESFGFNPLLLVEPTEIYEFINLFDSEVGLLLDVGHLRVSSETLGFSPQKAMQKLDQITSGYHLHANAGLKDDHLAISQSEWFLPLLNQNVAFATLEIHSQDVADIRTSLKSMQK